MDFSLAELEARYRPFFDYFHTNLFDTVGKTKPTWKLEGLMSD
jgi:hypothetical protein